MEVAALARAVLFGRTLEEKLTSADGLTDERPGAAIAVPDFPTRPAELFVAPGAHPNARAAFPAEDELATPGGRGRLLHFFANHELLAMELMALVLLRFPDAPAAFRQGLARTIGEEQAHMRLYLDRMRELGCAFGELPLSRYFWDALAQAKSPLEFTVAMSLTFEQANLDFSAHYRDAVARAGDAETATLLDRVYREEIGHVKHGVAWFNRWRHGPPGESDWDAYRRLLPVPLTPRRARGISYQRDARREAGLSEAFIRALAVQGGARGRPPVVWLYNPLCEAEVARGPLTPSATHRRVIRDLEHVPMFLAGEQDVVLVERPPRVEWLEGLSRAGFAVPEFARSEALPDKLGGAEPWGWSPSALALFAPLAERLVPSHGTNAAWVRALLARGDFAGTGLGPLFSKSWSAAFLADWLAARPELEPVFGPASDAGRVCRSWPEARDAMRALAGRGSPVMVKGALGTAGMQARRFDADGIDDPRHERWVAGRLADCDAVVVEPYLQRTSDLSMQLEMSKDGVRLLGMRRFLTGRQHEYLGTFLGGPRAGFSAEELRFLHEEGPGGRPFERFQEAMRAVGEALARAGLEGPAGVDAFLHRAPDGGLRLRPVVEVNPRWTMGRVALELERRLARGAGGAWIFLPQWAWTAKSEHTVDEQIAELERLHPPVLTEGSGPPRLLRGLVWTSDPATRPVFQTALAAGDAAVEALLGLVTGRREA